MLFFVCIIGAVATIATFGGFILGRTAGYEAGWDDRSRHQHHVDLERSRAAGFEVLR